MFRQVIRRMLEMRPLAWEIFLRCLQMSCLFLFCALLLLLKDDPSEGSEFGLRAASFQEIAQVSLLLGAIIPVIVEDLQGPAPKNPPGSSGR